MATRRHLSLPWRRSAAMLTVLLLIGGCATTPDVVPPVPEPVAAPVQEKTVKTEPPVYVLKPMAEKEAGQTFLTQFAATEAEPGAPGSLDPRAPLEPLLLPPEGCTKISEDQVSLWLYVYLDVPQTLAKITLKTGSAEAAQLYLNGKQVYSGGETPRPFRPDADVVPGLTLTKGRNLLVVHVRSTTPQWRFSLRFFSADGLPLLWTPLRTAHGGESRGGDVTPKTRTVY